MTHTVAENVQYFMDAKGWNPSLLARRADLNHANVYSLLSGKVRDPRILTLEKIAAALDVSLIDLISPNSHDSADGPQSPASSRFAQLEGDDLQTALKIIDALIAAKQPAA